MIHDDAKGEIMQWADLWHFEPTEEEAAFLKSSMTFSPNLPKFHRMTQDEGISTKLKVKGLLV